MRSGLGMLFSVLVLPSNCFSYIVGSLARVKFPSWINTRLIRLYARCFRIDVDECAKNVADYRSLAEFFVRDLRPGVRPIYGDVVSPVDGYLVEFGRCENGQMFQAKGKTYSTASLLGDDALGRKYLGGTYLTFYLSPANYHHIHSPVGGAITDMLYIRGRLWPVTHWAVRHVSDLYSRNERVVTVVSSEEFGLVSVVAVGATNVGAIALAYDDLVTNSRERIMSGQNCGTEQRNYSPGKGVMVGERLATFKMGSTVILLFEPGRICLSERCAKGPIKFGEALSCER
ncbi:MAG: phosphatidylserine decarboxylase [Deltaproteobacteria bacterium]|nr:phosphatidylserine decarboxylase [Deltaproteobacteria bacterium]